MGLNVRMSPHPEPASARRQNPLRETADAGGMGRDENDRRCQPGCGVTTLVALTPYENKIHSIHNYNLRPCNSPVLLVFNRAPGRRHPTVTHMTSGTTNRLYRSSALSKRWDRGVEAEAEVGPEVESQLIRRTRSALLRSGRRIPDTPRHKHTFGPPMEETAKVGACSVVLRPSGRTPPPRGECAADAHAAVGPRARPRPHPHHRRHCSNGDGGRLSATTPRPRLREPAPPPDAAGRQTEPSAGAPQPPAQRRRSPWH